VVKICRKISRSQGVLVSRWCKLTSFRKAILVAAVSLLLLLRLTPMLTQSQAKPKPLSKDTVIRLLKGDVSPIHVADLAREHGIDFQMTPETERELRQAGADNNLVNVLRSLVAKTVPAEPKERAAVKPEGRPAGTVRVNSKDGLKYVWIPPGSFEMGCSTGDNECFEEEKPAHQVTITKGFWLGQTPVTAGAYKRFASETGRAMPPEPKLGNNALNPGWGNEQMPIVNVTWDESEAYCQWAGGRLPTEAQWEYAARAGSGQARYGPLDDVAWYVDNSGRERIDSARWSQDSSHYGDRLAANGNTIHPVGLKRPNDWRLYDTLGNFWEWVDDWYDQKYYQNSPAVDPAGPAGGEFRVRRGGSWLNFPWLVRVSVRLRYDPGYLLVNYGCRCLREGDIP
jgi:formylglycine-generating enzyme required for sulfatase activity